MGSHTAAAAAPRDACQQTQNQVTLTPDAATPAEGSSLGCEQCLQLQGS